jgi:hypothetical protein
VTLSYAPISSTGTASATAPIPRFILGANSTAQALNVVVGPCQTILLFPYVTSIGGLDTGMAISNTSMDPFSTATSTGTCAMYFYGMNAPATFNVGPIPAGNGADPSKWAFTASTVAPNFDGYDIGARNLAMGYLALIVNNGQVQTSFRGQNANVQGESLNN